MHLIYHRIRAFIQEGLMALIHRIRIFTLSGLILMPIPSANYQNRNKRGQEKSEQ